MKTSWKNRFFWLVVFALFFTNLSVCANDSGILVKAKGSKANGVYSQFRLIVNDVYCGLEHTSSNFEDYYFQIPFSTDEVKMIKIEFLNDHYSIGEDRNLCVHSIVINDEIPILASTDNVKYVCINGQEYPYCGMMHWNGSLLFDISKIRFHPGNVVLSSQREVDAFTGQHLEGDLTICGNDITDLSPLSKLASIKGSLVIKGNPNLEGIAGFDELSIVNYIHIENNDRLVQVTGFNALQKCGGFYVRNNRLLKTIVCFQNPIIAL